MREILFQGKKVKSNNPCGNYCDSQDWIVGLPCPDPDDEDKIKFIDNLAFNKIEVIPESVGEYTGVRDSDNVRIFENDIVTFTLNSNSRYVVEYDNDNCCFVLSNMENKSIKFQLNSLLANECTIVRNLFEAEE